MSPKTGFTKRRPAARRPTARGPRPTAHLTAHLTAHGPRPAAHGPAARGPLYSSRPHGPRPTTLPTARGPPHGPRPGGLRPGQYIYIFLRLLQDGGYSTRETGNYQNNTPASQWLAHIGLGHI